MARNSRSRGPSVTPRWVIRQRFDRSLLLEYLLAVGIRADDEDFYGPGALVVQIVDYHRRQLTAQQVREDLGW